MKICYSVKQLGKKHPIINQAYLEINDLECPTTLKKLLTNIVNEQVADYNKKRQDPIVLTILDPTQIKSASREGKVDFGALSNTTLADKELAIENALQAFEDGLFAVFLDDDQVEWLTSPIDFDETTIFSFIRLTFLAGSFW